MELSDALTQACLANGHRTALEGGGSRLTYAQLLREAQALALQLRDRGIGRVNGRNNGRGGAEGDEACDTVMVKCSNDPTDFVAFLGVWLAGAVTAPVHRSTPAEVVATIQAKAQCRAYVDLLTDGPYPSNPAHPSVIQTIDVVHSGQIARRALLHGGAFVIFTSGSTGLPKGVVLSHRAFHGKLLENQRLFGASSATVTLLVLNNTFSFGIWVALMTLLQGGRVVAESRFSPASFLDTIASAGITFLGAVPTMIRATFGTLSATELERARHRIANAAKLSSVVIGGESLGTQLSATLRAFIAPASLYDVYGLTETSTSDFVLDPRDYAAHEASIGKPAPGVEYRVVNEVGLECAAGDAGELQLKTPFIMAGYLGDEALTRAAFSDGWFRTGDIAAYDCDGFVQMVGRLKELIIRGGNKITPVEVERALRRCAGIADAMVVGLPDAILGQRIHALLVPQAPSEAQEKIDIERLRSELQTRLEKYKCPDVYYIGSALPTGRTGKIDRGQLQQWITSAVVQPVKGATAPEPQRD